jgi:hypothetical protein
MPQCTPTQHNNKKWILVIHRRRLIPTLILTLMDDFSEGSNCKCNGIARKLELEIEPEGCN